MSKKIKLYVTVELHVDVEAWMLEYGIAETEVAEDVVSYVEHGLLRGSRMDLERLATVESITSRKPVRLKAAL